jgi:mRNA interferase RelE/StbE
MAYLVGLTNSAKKELSNLPDKEHDKIIEHLQSLESNPRPFGAEKLKGRKEYKLRVGNYRIIYGIDDTNKEVVIYLIDDRKQVYRRLKRR